MKVTIYLVGENTHWLARAYNDETDQHIWSSEDASSPAQALSELADQISVAATLALREQRQTEDPS